MDTLYNLPHQSPYPAMLVTQSYEKRESFWCRNPWVLPVLGIGAGLVIEKQWEDHHRSDGVRLVFVTKRCK